jgi:HEAT repeat protein
MDICSNVMFLSKGKNKDAYSLILQVIEKKTEYSRALECSIVAVGLYGKLKNGKWHGDKRSIPVLKNLVNDKDPKIRVQSAGALLSLGEGDLALPVLDELAKSGIPQSITALKRLFALEEREVNGIKRIVLSDTKLLDKRGEKILIKSLNYSSNEVKAFAAVRLAHMGIEKKRVEDTAITVLERLIDKKERGYKKAREWRSDKTAGYYAIAALEKIKSSAGINVLKKFLNNNYDASLQKRAKLALENIQQK